MQVEEVKEFLQPLFQKILEAVTVETVEDWACCLTDISVRKNLIMSCYCIQLLTYPTTILG